MTIEREYHVESTKSHCQISAKEMEWLNGGDNWLIPKPLKITFVQFILLFRTCFLIR